MVEPATKEYQSQFVEERYFKKPVPKFNLGEIIRVEHIMKSHEEYYDKVCVVAGWSRTLRYDFYFSNLNLPNSFC